MARSKSHKGKPSKSSKTGNGRKEAAPSLVKARLFLVTPPDLSSQDLAVRFGQAVAGGDIACILVTGDTPELLRERVEALLPIASAHNVAVVVDNDPELAVALGADGVQVPADLEIYGAARALLQDEMIVGVMCGASRHAAMELGEAGADYVAFDDRFAPDDDASDFDDEEDDEPHSEDDAAPFSLVSWWASVFEVPCVVFEPMGDDEARLLAGQGVEFIRPLDELWLSGDAAGATVSRLNKLFEEVLHDEKS